MHANKAIIAIQYGDDVAIQKGDPGPLTNAPCGEEGSESSCPVSMEGDMEGEAGTDRDCFTSGDEAGDLSTTDTGEEAPIVTDGHVGG